MINIENRTINGAQTHRYAMQLSVNKKILQLLPGKTGFYIKKTCTRHASITIHRYLLSNNVLENLY